MKGSRITYTKRGLDAVAPQAKRYELWDDAAPGLGFRVQPTGVKGFVFRYRVGGGRAAPKRFMFIGTYGKVTLDQARKEARRLAGEVAEGRDPAADRNAAREEAQRGGDTIADLAARFMADHVQVERKAATIAGYRHVINRYILPDLGRKRIGEVDAAAVRKLRLSLRAKPGIANKTVAVLSSMFSFGARNGLVKNKDNPAEGIKPHHPAGARADAGRRKECQPQLHSRLWERAAMPPPLPAGPRGGAGRDGAGRVRTDRSLVAADPHGPRQTLLRRKQVELWQRPAGRSDGDPVGPVRSAVRRHGPRGYAVGQDPPRRLTGDASWAGFWEPTEREKYAARLPLVQPRRHLGLPGLDPRSIHLYSRALPRHVGMARAVPDRPPVNRWTPPGEVAGLAWRPGDIVPGKLGGTVIGRSTTGRG